MVQRANSGVIAAVFCLICVALAFRILPLRAQQAVLPGERVPANAKAREKPPEPAPGEGANFELVVLDASTGAPVPGVHIELNQLGRPPEIALKGKAASLPPTAFYEASTNSAGKATFSNIIAAPYGLRAKADGRVLVEGSPTTVMLEKAKAASKDEDKPVSLILHMFTASRVSGVVMDREKTTLANAQVELVQEAWIAGLRAMERAQPPVATDEEGRFHFFGVLPGAYYIRVVPSLSTIALQLRESEASSDPELKHSAYVNTLYPSTPYLENAAAINLYEGSHLEGLTIEVQRQKYYRLAGRLENLPPEQKSRGLSLFRLLSYTSRFEFLWNDIYNGAKSVEVAADGTFAYEMGLPPGPYWAGFVPAGIVRGGAEFRIIDEDLTDLRVRLEPGMTFQGRVVDEDGKQIQAMPARVSTFAGQRYIYSRDFFAGPDGRFNTSGIRQEHYILEFPDQPVVIRKIQTQDRTFDGPHFDLSSTSGTAVVTVSSKGASVGGMVELDRRAKDYPRGMVTLTTQPRDPVDGVRRTRLDGNNRYQFEHLPPGGYRVCAWLEEGSEINRVLGNPAYEANLGARCARVDIKEDESKQADAKQFSAYDVK